MARAAKASSMIQDDILEECLEVHRRLLTVEREFHAWLSQMTGFEVSSGHYTRRRPDS